jgi:hypothetical protein
MATLETVTGGGYGANSFKATGAANLDDGNMDDGSIAVDITAAFGGGPITYFGVDYTEIYINTNGLITFGAPITTYTPTGIDSLTEPAIAPFWSDVDIRGPTDGDIYWDVDATTGKVTITWLEVAAYSGGTGAERNSFQVILSDTGGGDLSIEFIYGDIEWTDGGFGSASVGITDAEAPPTFVELPGTDDDAALINFDTTDFGNGDPDGTWEMDIDDTGTILTSNGVVDGTSGDDIIDVTYEDDPENDWVDNNDGTGVDRNDDVIDGAGGDDTITAGEGDDQITGGAGNDTFIYNAGDGNDTITDFGAGSTDINDGDDTNNDYIDLTPFYTNSTELLADLADDGILNQSDGSDYTDNTAIDGSITGLSGLTGQLAASIEEQTGVTCFVKGTLVTTDRGDVRVESLVPGDQVLTLDRGYQTLRLALNRTVDAENLRANPKLLPVRITAGAMGAGLPKRDLWVSRQHRMVVKSKISARMFDSATVLVAAIKLTEMPKIDVDETATQVTYFHLLFDNHEVVYAESAPSESFFLGPETRKTVPAAAWEEITTLFPHVADLAFTPAPALTIPSNSLQKQLVRRHLKNSKALLTV